MAYRGKVIFETSAFKVLPAVSNPGTPLLSVMRNHYLSPTAHQYEGCQVSHIQLSG